MTIPEFKTEAEEAKWWDANQDLVLKELQIAAQSTPRQLGRGTLRKRTEEAK